MFLTKSGIVGQTAHSHKGRELDNPIWLADTWGEDSERVKNILQSILLIIKF